MVNAGGRECHRNLLLLNHDVTAVEAGWAGSLGQIARKETGVAGAVLLYGSGNIQHAGIVTGLGKAQAMPAGESLRATSGAGCG